MLQLPPILAARYRAATDREVHGQSFGLLKAPRNPTATAWEQRRGTLEDQAIFGPLVDFECACGKYSGRQYRNMICHHCGVKLTTRLARRQRFGHIDLPAPIIHPLGGKVESVASIPVLPAAFIESPGGARLTDLYEEVVQSVACASLEGVARSFHDLLELLLPVVLVAHEWNLQEADVLTRGMALAPRTGPPGLLCACGYPLEGLDVSVCPGCGKKPW